MTAQLAAMAAYIDMLQGFTIAATVNVISSIIAIIVARLLFCSPVLLLLCVLPSLLLRIFRVNIADHHVPTVISTSE